MGSPKRHSGKEMSGVGRRSGSENKDDMLRVTIGNERFDKDSDHHSSRERDDRHSRDYSRRRDEDRHHYERESRYREDDDRYKRERGYDRERYDRDHDRERYDKDHDRDKYDKDHDRDKYDKDHDRDKYDKDHDRDKYDKDHDRDKYDKDHDRDKSDKDHDRDRSDKDHDRERSDKDHDRDRYRERSSRSSTDSYRPRAPTSSLSLEDDYRLNHRGQFSKPYSHMGPRSTLSLEEDKRLASREKEERSRDRVSPRERELERGKSEEKQKEKECERVLSKPELKEGLAQQQFGKWGDELENDKPKVPSVDMFKSGNWKPISLPSIGGDADVSEKDALSSVTTNVPQEPLGIPLRSILKGKKMGGTEVHTASETDNVDEASSSKSLLFPVLAKEWVKEDIDRRNTEHRAGDRSDIDNRDINRGDIDRREVDRGDIDRHEVDRSDIDRREVDRGDIDKCLTDSLDIDRRISECRDIDRRLTECRDIDSRVSERRELGRQEYDEREEYDKRPMGRPNIEKYNVERQTLDRSNRSVRNQDYNYHKAESVSTNIEAMDFDDEDAFLYGDSDADSQVTKKLHVPSPVTSLTGPKIGLYHSPKLGKNEHERDYKRDHYLQERSPSPDHKRRRERSPDSYYRNQSPDRLTLGKEKRESTSPVRLTSLGRSPQKSPIGRRSRSPSTSREHTGSFLGRAPSSPQSNVSRKRPYFRDSLGQVQNDPADVDLRHSNAHQQTRDLHIQKDVDLRQDIDSRGLGKTSHALGKAAVDENQDIDSRDSRDSDSRRLGTFSKAYSTNEPLGRKKSSSEVPPWEKKRLEREATSNKSSSVSPSKNEESKDEKKEGHDPTIENILKSIGFNFELSKLMQEKGNKERQKPKETEEFGIKESSSFMDTGIVAQEELKEKKKSTTHAQESYADRAKRYIQEHAMAKAMGRASPLPFAESEKRREEKEKARLKAESQGKTDRDARYRREERSRSQDKYHRSRSRSRDRLSRSRSRDRRSRSREMSHEREHYKRPIQDKYRSRSRSRSQTRYSRSRSRSYSHSSSPDRDSRRYERSASPSPRSYKSSHVRRGSEEYSAYGDQRFENRTTVRYIENVHKENYTPPSSDVYSGPTLGVPPHTLGVPPPTLGVPQGTRNNLRILSSESDPIVSPTNSKRTVIPPRLGKDKLIQPDPSRHVEEITERRKVMIKGPVVKDIKKEMTSVRTLTASERATLLAQSAERTRRLAALEKELERLRKQQNELMRKRQRQKDGHKDPLLIENSKLQEEIAIQISALRKAVEENSTALYEDPKSIPLGKKPEIGSKSFEESRDVKMTHLKKDDEGDIAYEYYDGGNHWCRPCNYISSNVYTLFEHITSKKHLLKLSPYERPWMPEPEEKKQTPKGQVRAAALTGAEFLWPTQAFYCTLCKDFSGDNMCAEQHLKSTSHNNNYKKYCVDNPFYERRFTLDKAAGVSMISGFKSEPVKEEKELGRALGKAPKSQSPKSQPQKLEPKQETLKRQVPKPQPMKPASIPPTKEHLELERRYRNQKGEVNSKRIIPKERREKEVIKEAIKEVINIDDDTPAPTHHPIVRREYGVAKKVLEPPVPEILPQDINIPTVELPETKASTEKETLQRKSISIKLTGKTSLANKPANNPLAVLTRSIPKPVAAPQRAPAFMTPQQQQKRPPIGRNQTPPPSLDNFLSIDKGGALPMFASPLDISDPSLWNLSAADLKKINEMKMLGILPSEKQQRLEPVHQPSTRLVAPSKVAASLADVFSSDKNNGSAANKVATVQEDDDEVEMDMGDFDILDECGDA